MMNYFLPFSGTSFIWFAVDVVFLLSYFQCRDAQCTLEDWSPFWGPSEFNNDVNIGQGPSEIFDKSSSLVYPNDKVRSFSDFTRYFDIYFGP